MSNSTSFATKAGAFALALALVLPVTPVFAGGGDDSSGTTTPPVDCVKQKGKGWTYSEQEKKCVKTSSLDDGALYKQGRALALASHYDSALDSLTAIRN